MHDTATTTFRLGPEPGTVLPEYGGLGLANVVPTVERYFGLDTPVAPLSDDVLPPALLEGVHRVVTLLIDALGYEQLTRAMERGLTPRLSALAQRDAACLSALTSTFPSTTVTALTTLGTGLPPGRHGIVTHNLYDAALGTTIDMLRFAPALAGVPLDSAGVEPADWLNSSTVYERLAGLGVGTEVVNHSQFEGSALSKMNHRGASYTGFRTVSDLCVNLRAIIERSEDRAYVHAYWGTLDTVTHVYGAGSPQHDAEIRVLDYAIGELLLADLRSPDTLLLLLADHGHLDSSPDRQVWLNDHPDLLALLTSPPAGLDRASVLYVRPGCEDEARTYAETHLSGQAHVFTAEESVRMGFYGRQPLTSAARQRIGQLLLLPRENWLIKYAPLGWERRQTLVGKHGGLSVQEMLIPLLAMRL